MQELPAFGVREVFIAEDVSVEAGIVALFGLLGADCLHAGAVVGVGAFDSPLVWCSGGFVLVMDGWR